MSNVRLGRHSVRNLTALHFFYRLERNPMENTQKKRSFFCYWATSPDWGISSFHSEVAHITALPFCAKIGRKNQDMQYSLSAAYNPAPFTGTCSHSLKEFLLRYLGGTSKTQLDLAAPCLSKGLCGFCFKRLSHVTTPVPQTHRYSLQTEMPAVSTDKYLRFIKK